MEEKPNIPKISDKIVINTSANGQYVEEILDRCVQKLYEDYEINPSRKVNIAITHIETAILWLDKREDITSDEDEE